MAIATTKRREQQIERPAQRSATLQRYQHTAGALLASAGAIALMAIITAEALYPAAYDTTTSTISDLGATLPPNSVILQPSATIFDVAMVVIGLMIMAGAAFLQRALGRKTLSVALGLFGLGALGVGVFPGNHLAPHQLFAMLAFISGGVAALVSARVLTTPRTPTFRRLGSRIVGELLASHVHARVGPGRGARRGWHRAVDRVSGDPVADHVRGRVDGTCRRSGHENEGS